MFQTITAATCPPAPYRIGIYRLAGLPHDRSSSATPA